MLYRFICDGTGERLPDCSKKPGEGKQGRAVPDLPRKAGTVADERYYC